jgi:hypothetical protein
MAEPAPRATRKTLNILLLICSISVPYSIFLTAYIFNQWHEIAELKADLLSQKELQTELLGRQPLSQTLMPHMVDEIGLALNPFTKQSSIAAHEGETYPVNSLGLRGAEIEQKQPGVTRILVVGDSVVFGWKVREEDKLSSILNRYMAERISDDTKVEFLTIGLLGWNVRSEVAFLESHIYLLEPDLILWWSIENDIADTPGVVPPGVLAIWASSQAKNQSPFAPLSNYARRSGSIMPAIGERRSANIDLIASFQAKYGVPVVVLDLPALDLYQQSHSFDPPRIFIPPQIMDDRRWSVAPGDRHPSAWANHAIALGVLRRLVELGKIPAVELTAAEATVVNMFDEEEARKRSLEQPADITRRLRQIPTEYKMEQGRKSTSVLYGIGSGGELAKAGTLFLRDPGNNPSIELTIAPPPNIDKYPGSARFTVRSRDLEETQTTASIDAATSVVRLPLPPQAGLRVYEISWLFDYTCCEGPSACSSGKLIHAGFSR